MPSSAGSESVEEEVAVTKLKIKVSKPSRPRDLLHKLSTVKALRAAFKGLRSRKSSRGADDVTLLDFERSLEAELRSIQRSLRTGSYRFTPLRPRAIPKTGGKYRPILIPAVRDRVVQRALLGIIEPAIEPHIGWATSHAFRTGRGVRTAVRALENEICSGKSVVLLVDIAEFFPSIDSDQLFADVLALLPDDSLKKLLTSLQDWEIHDLKALPPRERDAFPEAGCGIPQGSILSPLLSNFYLRSLDSEAAARGTTAIRYADDIAVPCSSEEEAVEAFDWLRSSLTGLGLRVHPLGKDSKSRIVRNALSGFEYLGFYLHGSPGATRLTIHPSHKSFGKAKAAISDILDPANRAPLSDRYARLSHFLSGWLGAYGHVCDVRKECSQLLEHAQNALERLLRSRKLLAAGLSKNQRRFLGVNSIFSDVGKRVQGKRSRPSKSSVL
jgi:RNA-directed DNA polymerase